jgi:hypothetical protein
MPPAKQKSVLLEANELIFGDRRHDYGHPIDDYTRTAGLINAEFADQLKTPFTPEDVMLMMILVKVSRHHNRPKRDNLVDIAGYAGCIHECGEERKRREAKT